VQIRSAVGTHLGASYLPFDLKLFSAGMASFHGAPLLHTFLFALRPL
jgi:hypothetical protein